MAHGIWQTVNNIFGPQTLETVDSKYSRSFRVVKSLSDVYISTGILTQSGGLVRDVWLPIIKILKTHNSSLKNILILGLAGGTLAKMLNKINPRAQITGVEIDPAMIYLGKKYLGLDTIPNLKIIIGDARNKIIKSDVIFVDLYLGDQVPNFVYTKSFLSKLTQSAELIIINHLFYDQIKKQNAEKLIKSLEKLSCEIKLHRVLTNVLIIATPKNLRPVRTPPHQTVS